MITQRRFVLAAGTGACLALAVTIGVVSARAASAPEGERQAQDIGPAIRTISDAGGFAAGGGQTGACCLADGSCVNTSQADCDAQNGNWQEKIPCSDTICNVAGTCIFDNGPGVVTGSKSASQYAWDKPFFSESADDFTLKGDPAVPCEIANITWFVRHDIFQQQPPPPNEYQNTPKDYKSIRVTIYNDTGLPQGMGKGPDGQPRENGTHVGLVKHEVIVPASKFAWNRYEKPVGTPVPNSFVIDMDLSQFEIKLEQNVKYWLAIAPEWQFNQGYRTFWLGSQTHSGHRAQEFDPFFNGVADWIKRDHDLAFRINGAKQVQTGACCDHAQAGGVCVSVKTESDCLGDPALEQPEWFKNQSCAAVEANGLCEEHTGACCDHAQPGGVCDDGVTETACLGDGTREQPEWFKDLSCVSVEMPPSLCNEHTGACCDHAQAGGVCVGAITESACIGDPTLEQPEWFKDLDCASIELGLLCEEHTGACCDKSQPGGLCISGVPQSDCFPAPVFFTNKSGFDTFMIQTGKVLKGVEDFEESNIPDGGKQNLPDPLEGNVKNIDVVTGFGFPNGLVEKNLIIQANITPGPSPPAPNPSGDPFALYVVGQGFLGANSVKIGEDLFLAGVAASLDLIFTEPNHTGVGFELSRFAGFGTGAGWHITVYDKADVVLGKFQVPPVSGPEPGKTFFGVWSTQTIGRINIFDKEPSPAPEAIDNIQMWTDETPPQIQWFKDGVCVQDGGTIDCLEHTGACCDGTTGICTDNVPESLCPTGSPVAKISVLSVDCNPFAGAGFVNTMGEALQLVDQGGEFNVTEVTPAAFRVMTAVLLSSFDLIAINNDPSRIDCGSGLGLGTTWHSVVGVNAGGRVLLTSHDAPRFHMNFSTPPVQFPAGPGTAPYGADEFVRKAALWTGGGSQTGLLIFNDAQGFVGGTGWDNPELNLPGAWGISDLVQNAFIWDGGYTDILPGFATHPIYAGCSDARFGVNSISSFAANIGDASYHSTFGSFNGAIFTTTEVVINTGVIDVGGLCPGCALSAAAGPDGTAISIIRDGPKDDPDNQFRWEKDTLCANLNPPCEEHTGACCLADGTCINDKIEGDCLAGGGNWNAKNTCASVICNVSGTCIFDNGPGDPDSGQWIRSQYVQDFPLFLEGADDFTLKGGPEPCEITNITWHVFHGPGAPTSTPKDYKSIRVTIYNDTGLPQGEGKGPDGEPLPDGTHVGLVKHELTILQDKFTWVNYEKGLVTYDDIFLIDMDVSQFGIKLDQNVKYWLAIAPEWAAGPTDARQTLWLGSQRKSGHSAQRFVEPGPWQKTTFDLAFRISGFKQIVVKKPKWTQLPHPTGEGFDAPSNLWWNKTPPVDKTCDPPGICPDFTPCGLAGTDCLCMTRVDGTANCAHAPDCATAAPCPSGDVDCPDGTKCFTGTCCLIESVCLSNCSGALAASASPADLVSAERFASENEAAKGPGSLPLY